MSAIPPRAGRRRARRADHRAAPRRLVGGGRPLRRGERFVRRAPGHRPGLPACRRHRRPAGAGDIRRPRRRPLAQRRNGVPAMSHDGWHRVDPVDVPDEGRVRSAVVGRPQRRPDPLRRCGSGRWTTAARTRAARWARARSRTAGCAARGTATTTTRSTGQPPAGFSDARHVVRGRGARGRRVRAAAASRRAASRTVADVLVETLVAWGVDARVRHGRATPTSGSPTRCAAPRSAAS